MVDGYLGDVMKYENGYENENTEGHWADGM